MGAHVSFCSTYNVPIEAYLHHWSLLYSLMMRIIIAKLSRRSSICRNADRCDTLLSPIRRSISEQLQNVLPILVDNPEGKEKQFCKMWIWEADMIPRSRSKSE